ncbi:hypothetical protein [uncultured Clostridium sp.]|uniref:hypothetical protein n=1 Tax=uncultured Clostridium sp. TaxID=59620 RepID=UPI0028E8E4CB|nr:hypothetical protein [uncultured Clostridium sp.]
MKLNNKKIIAVFLLVLTLVVGGCSKKESPTPDGNNANGQEQNVDVKDEDKDQSKDDEDQPKEEEKEEDKIVKEEDLTEKLKKESLVADGQVYFQGEYVIATILAKDGSKEEDVKKLADTYAQDLKKEYSDKKVNVQAICNGKNVATVILEE